MPSSLPDDFVDLEPWIDWAQPTELLRNQKRWAATMEESQSFYDIMQERCGAALSYLDQFALTALDEKQTTLLHLCLGLAEVAITIEMYGEPQPKYVFPIERFVPLHDSWVLGYPGQTAGAAA